MNAVAPTFSSVYTANRHRADAKLFGEVHQHAFAEWGIAYFGDRLLGQLRLRMLFYAKIRRIDFSAVLSRIVLIFFVSAPHQVAQSIVSRISVFVTAFHSCWSVANKRAQDKRMNASNSRNSIHANVNEHSLESLTRVIGNWLENFAFQTDTVFSATNNSIYGSDSTVRVCLVSGSVGYIGPHNVNPIPQPYVRID